MELSLIFWILLAALFHATWNVIVKSGTNKLYETALNSFGGGIGMFFVAPWLPLPAQEAWPLLAGSCLVHLTYYVSMSFAYRFADMSYAYTIMRGTAPLFTALFLLCTGMSLTTFGWFGIVCLCVGVLTLSLDSFRHARCNFKGTAAAFGTAFVIMGYTLFDGFGARASGNAISYVCWLYIVNFFPLNLFLLVRDGRKYTSYFHSRWKIGLFGGICSLASYGVALWAMTLAPIALVAALRETSVIFGMLLALLFLGERITLWKVVAVCLVTGGTMLLRLG